MSLTFVVICSYGQRKPHFSGDDVTKNVMGAYVERRERKSPLMLQVEERFGQPLPDLLRERHRALGNYTLVAAELDLSAPTVYYWFRKFNIPLSRYVVPDFSAEAEKVEVPA